MRSFGCRLAGWGAARRAVAAVAGVALAVGFSVTSAQSPLRVTWANNLLSIQSNGAPLAEVVLEVARLTGLEVMGIEKVSGTVKLEVSEVALQEGLKQLLAGANFMLGETAAAPGAPPRPALRILSMAGTAIAGTPAHAPLVVPVLDVIVAADTAAEADEQAEDNDDPDVDADKLDAKLEAARLASEGAFTAAVAVSDLVEHLEDGNPEVRVQALTALATRPMKVALGPLTDALGDDAAIVRNAAVDALGRATDRESLAKIGQMLEQHDDIGVRIGALRVLALRADPASAIHLRRALKDADNTVREAAAQMLAELDRRAKEEKARGGK